MPNDNGVGFKGVKIQSENRAAVQCYECGRWFKVLGSHISKFHGMKMDEYNDKYGFCRNENQMSDVSCNKAADHINKVINNAGKRMCDSKLQKLRVIGQKKDKYDNSIQEMNRYGTCPLQLKAYLADYIHRFKRLPSNTSGKYGFGKYNVYRRRFGSFNNALKSYGLPVRYKIGHKTEFVFEDGTQYFCDTRYDNDELYSLLMEKCEIMKTKFTNQEA